MIPGMLPPRWYYVAMWGDDCRPEPRFWHPGCARSPSWGRDELWTRTDAAEEVTMHAPLAPVSPLTCAVCGSALPNGWLLAGQGTELRACPHCGARAVKSNITPRPIITSNTAVLGAAVHARMMPRRAVLLGGRMLGRV